MLPKTLAVMLTATALSAQPASVKNIGGGCFLAKASIIHVDKPIINRTWEIKYSFPNMNYGNNKLTGRQKIMIGFGNPNKPFMRNVTVGSGTTIIGCTLRTTTDFIFSVVPYGTMKVALPNSMAFVGRDFYVQGIWDAKGHLELTDAYKLTIGRW